MDIGFGPSYGMATTVKYAATLRSPIKKIVLGIVFAVLCALVPSQMFAQRHPVAAGRAGGARTAPMRSPGIVRSGVPFAGSRFVSPLYGGSSSTFGRWRIPRNPIFFGYSPFHFGYTGTWGPHCGLETGWTYPCAVTPLYGYIGGPIYEPVSPEYYNFVNPLPFTYPDLGQTEPEGTAGGLPKQIVIYLKDGSVYGVANYSVSAGKLQYTTSDGADNSIDLDAVDIQKTTDANAARGVKFSTEPRAPQPLSPAPNAGPNSTPNPAPIAAPPQL